MTYTVKPYAEQIDLSMNAVAQVVLFGFGAWFWLLWRWFSLNF